MVEIAPGLFLGSQQDYETVPGGWAVVQACKEPFHRQALGYTTAGAPREHPEYFVARRGHRLILNLVDAPRASYISRVIVEQALAFARLSILDGLNVLIHCNEGKSRASLLGMLYLASFTDVLPASFAEAEAVFQGLYPPYAPGPGVRGFLLARYDYYRSQK